MEDMLNNYPSIILRDDVVEGFVVEGCFRTKDGVGNGFGRCSVNDNVGLNEFLMEEFSYRRKRKVKKVF